MIQFSIKNHFEFDLMLRTNVIVILIVLVEKIYSSFEKILFNHLLGFIPNSGQMPIPTIVQRRLNNTSVFWWSFKSFRFSGQKGINWVAHSPNKGPISSFFTRVFVYQCKESISTCTSQQSLQWCCPHLSLVEQVFNILKTILSNKHLFMDTK